MEKKNFENNASKPSNKLLLYLKELNFFDKIFYFVFFPFFILVYFYLKFIYYQSNMKIIFNDKWTENKRQNYFHNSAILINLLAEWGSF